MSFLGFTKFRLRKQPRRVILAAPFNHEFDWLEAKFAQLGDAVDLFMILESNLTAGGDPKELSLLNKLRLGYLKQYHSKLVYIYQDYFPPGYIEDGWKADM